MDDEPLAATLQDRRPPDQACPLFHPAARREPLDFTPLRADSFAHHATRVAPDLIAVRTRSEGMRSEIEAAGVSLKGTTRRANAEVRCRWQPRASREGLLSTRREGGKSWLRAARLVQCDETGHGGVPYRKFRLILGRSVESPFVARRRPCATSESCWLRFFRWQLR
jgi:hypothetical protein